MKISIKNLLLIVAVISIVGCRLRGEAHSLNEIYADAQSAFKGANHASLPTEVSTSLETVSKSLATAGKKPSKEVIASSTKTIQEQLTALIPSAGYTVRPALTELRNQYLELSGSEAATNENFILIAARTYNLLADELNTQRFGIKYN